MTDLVRHRVRLPLRTPVRGIEHRDISLYHGPAGWGEASPFPGFPAAISACEAAAIEAATLPFPEPVRATVPVNGLVTSPDPVAAGREAAALAHAGYRTVKVKVGDRDDLARVAAVRAALGPDIGLRVDANGAWSVSRAIDRIQALSRHDLEFVEEPVSGLEALARVREGVVVPIAADESVRSLADIAELRRLGSADVLVLKVQACGGVRNALAWAEAAAIPVTVTSMIESSIGLAAGAALAAALPELTLACGLATASLLAADVTKDPLTAVAGEVSVRRIEPDPGLVARYGVAA